MNPKVDLFLAEGCGRCEYHATPMCKVHLWPQELILLRQLVLDCGLDEEVKWGVPCYTFNGKNIVNIGAFKSFAALSFFKGSLIEDVHNILLKPGENSQSGRLIKFTDPRQIIEQEDILKEYIFQAIEVEKLGLKVEFKKNPEPVPDELHLIFEEFPEVQEAFYDLTPGRQRGYIIHFSQPKQSITRTERIKKCIPKILNGEGFHDEYKKRN
ncbi:MAG: YdeI/OmpD-associated family protein [Saprospiraceae bacterium]|nr:YdeI/OmpD-associated family protein [Saprospiraceae bacterium]MBK8549351.1 YdeI/OmpD-associated family protein [Saprospiraceae bacterium]MBK8855250.1 YdeI/OmpD-associated family protein [Saprospiraceae bacterium]